MRKCSLLTNLGINLSDGFTLTHTTLLRSMFSYDIFNLFSLTFLHFISIIFAVTKFPYPEICVMTCADKGFRQESIGINHTGSLMIVGAS